MPPLSRPRLNLEESNYGKGEVCGGKAATLVDHQHYLPETLIRLDSLVRSAHFFHWENFVYYRTHSAASE
jgi:hypothetical protein